MTAMPRKKLPTGLRIDTPAHAAHILATQGDSSASALSSAASDSDFSLFNAQSRPRSHMNMKKLSISIPSAQSSTNSLYLPSEPQSAVNTKPPDLFPDCRARRSSIVSLPVASTPAVNQLIHRRDEEGSPTIPYADGPIQIIPGIWLGSEENARDWKGLAERGISAILNVAKEVTLPFESLQPSHVASSLPRLESSHGQYSSYYPPHVPSGRPGIHYLKLHWSHGQQNLVQDGFKEAMAFTDAALERENGVLIHCQCGISRSATLVIALIMRAAAEHSPTVPPEVWKLKGMHSAYSYVKEKSKWISPNMSLIYQLLEYGKKLKIDTGLSADSDNSSLLVDEEEWDRQRRMFDESPSDDEQESTLVMREAQALDRAMEDRITARRSSCSSLCSSNSGYGMGPAWRSRYGSRQRTGSIASSRTNGSILSEDLVEEDEESELLGVGGGFDSERNESSSTTSPNEDLEPSATHSKQVPLSFNNLRLPPTATRSAFELSRPLPRLKRRPPPIGLPPVPSSPVTLITDSPETTSTVINRCSTTPSPTLPEPSSVQRNVEPPILQRETRKSIPPPLHLRHSVLKKVHGSQDSLAKPSHSCIPPPANTPSQTLFVFPPSPTAMRTPSMLTVTSSSNDLTLLPASSTPRVSAFRSQFRTRSFIAIGTPATPTTAFTKLNVRGYVGIQG
ncbi:hypothetical protein AMATHDRAFT_52320 [Amanita thiersii Skay4041]|uniref:protein-tyrosine-phosphatase n=1 Tax=Amanita thiersii Skay4041 TaxID=703135 RepID=A0A2A9P1J0_9AGAR|nr:hypothetical protein AMATHDRAFT_52320 [Amanita thiersii Skay4041]